MQLATKKRTDQREQAQPQGTKAGVHDEESTHKYDELLAGAAEVQQLLDLVVLWVPVAVYVMFGDNREVMYIFSCLAVLLGAFSFFMEHCSYYKDFDRRARAGALVEQKDRKEFIALLIIVGIIKDLAMLLGVFACIQIIGRVWAWVTGRYPASPVVRFISALINKIRDQRLGVGSFILCMLWAYVGFPLWVPKLWIFFQLSDLLKERSVAEKKGKGKEGKRIQEGHQGTKSSGKKKHRKG